MKHKILICNNGPKHDFLGSTFTLKVPNTQFVPEKELRHFIKSLSPVAIGHDLIRIGADADGGYLVPDDLRGIHGLFSPGYGGRSNFEEMLAVQYGIKIFIADQIDKKETSLRRFLGRLKRNRTFCRALNFDFENKFIDTKNSETTIQLGDWIQKKVGNAQDDLILQMDIEGAEIDVLEDASIEILKKFRIMVIEFHSMGQLFHKSFSLRYQDIFKKILDDFVIAHIHPNNHCIMLSYKDIEIPVAMEFTFIRKDRVLSDNRKLVFPHKLDRNNTHRKPDLVLPGIWQG